MLHCQHFVFINEYPCLHKSLVGCHCCASVSSSPSSSFIVCKQNYLRVTQQTRHERRTASATSYSMSSTLLFLWLIKCWNENTSVSLSEPKHKRQTKLTVYWTVCWLCIGNENENIASQRLMFICVYLHVKLCFSHVSWFYSTVSQWLCVWRNGLCDSDMWMSIQAIKMLIPCTVPPIISNLVSVANIKMKTHFKI